MWNAKLDSVVFQAKLGDKAKTIGDKVRRIEKIAAALATVAGADLELVTSAARVCKADLASHAVGEFPELQGVMGRHYAKDFGLPDAVAVAIDEHWWPKGQGAALPTTAAGAILALADRMDTIVGCFAVGLEPSGSADPFGLRRAAIGIWQILLSRADGSSLWAPLLASARDALSAQGVVVKDPAAAREFFRARLRGIFVDEGIPAQDATRRSRRTIATRSMRAPGLSPARRSRRRRARCSSASRTSSTTRAARSSRSATRRTPSGFVSEVESNLYTAILDAQAREVAAPGAPATTRPCSNRSSELRPTVAAFFDKGGVMVMDPDPDAPRQPARAAVVVHPARTHDRRLPSARRCLVNHVRQFGGGTAEGRAKDKALLGGKGANLAEMASLGLPGAARLHDHDRGLPLRDGARRGQLSRRARRRGRRGARARRGADAGTSSATATHAAARQRALGCAGVDARA